MKIFNQESPSTKNKIQTPEKKLQGTESSRITPTKLRHLPIVFTSLSDKKKSPHSSPLADEKTNSDSASNTLIIKFLSQSREYYLRTGELKTAAATYQLGNSLAKSNKKQALEYYTQAAKLGYVPALCKVYNYYRTRREPEQQLKAPGYLDAAKREMAKIRIFLARFYQNTAKQLMLENEKIELKNLTLVSLIDDPRLSSEKSNFLTLLEKNREKITTNQQAITDNQKFFKSYFQGAVDLVSFADAESIYAIAQNYEDESSDIQDQEAAVRFYQLAANQNHIEALYNLANRYLIAWGVEKNEKYAADLFQRAALLGHIPSQYMLAHCYSEGVGFEKNSTEAEKWLQKSQTLSALPKEKKATPLPRATAPSVQAAASVVGSSSLTFAHYIYRLSADSAKDYFLDDLISAATDRDAEKLISTLAGLAKDSKLTHLQLAEEKLTDGDVEKLINALEGNITVKIIDLANNKIGDPGAIALGNFLTTNRTLSRLDLSGNPLTNQGLEALANGLKNNFTLTDLILPKEGNGLLHQRIKDYLNRNRQTPDFKREQKQHDDDLRIEQIACFPKDVKQCTISLPGCLSTTADSVISALEPPKNPYAGQLTEGVGQFQKDSGRLRSAARILLLNGEPPSSELLEHLTALTAQLHENQTQWQQLQKKGDIKEIEQEVALGHVQEPEKFLTDLMKNHPAFSILYRQFPPPVLKTLLLEFHQALLGIPVNCLSNCVVYNHPEAIPIAKAGHITANLSFENGELAVVTLATGFTTSDPESPVPLFSDPTAAVQVTFRSDPSRPLGETLVPTATTNSIQLARTVFSAFCDMRGRQYASSIIPVESKSPAGPPVTKTKSKRWSFFNTPPSVTSAPAETLAPISLPIKTTSGSLTLGVAEKKVMIALYGKFETQSSTRENFIMLMTKMATLPPTAEAADKFLLVSSTEKLASELIASVENLQKKLTDFDNDKFNDSLKTLNAMNVYLQKILVTGVRDESAHSELTLQKLLVQYQELCSYPEKLGFISRQLAEVESTLSTRSHRT